MTDNGHRTIKCSCGAVIANCRCFYPNKPVEIVERGCDTCKAEKARTSGE